MTATRIKLLISYDGTNYCGWQKQKDHAQRKIRNESKHPTPRLHVKEHHHQGEDGKDLHKKSQT